MEFLDFLILLHTDAGARAEEKADDVGSALEIFAADFLATAFDELEAAEPLFVFGRLGGRIVFDVFGFKRRVVRDRVVVGVDGFAGGRTCGRFGSELADGQSRDKSGREDKDDVECGFHDWFVFVARVCAPAGNGNFLYHRIRASTASHQIPGDRDSESRRDECDVPAQQRARCETARGQVQVWVDQAS